MTLCEDKSLLLSSQLKEQVKTLAEPRDNVDIFPPNGNLHRSSYRRLGSEEADIVMSETRSMLSQIKLKNEYKVTYPRRKLLIAQSLASVEQESEEKKLTVADIFPDTTVVCRTDYRTTTSRDFWSPYSPKPLSPPQPEPWLLNRRTIGYDLEDLENRCGYHTFLDDNMDLYQRIAELKRQRSKLYNPR